MIVALGLSVTNILLGWASSVSIASLAPLNPTDPFSALFTITNDGKFRLCEVQFACYLARVQYQSPDVPQFRHKVVRLTGFSVKSMTSGERQTIQCHTPMGPPWAVREVEAVIQVCFRSPLFLWQTAVERRFRTVVDGNRHFQWVHQPIVEAPFFSACYDLDKPTRK
jgi:hypothetical protein